MAKLDHLKEQIAYAKLWLGIAIVTDISVIGWLISVPESSERRTVILAFVGVALLTIGIGSMHRYIRLRIHDIGKDIGKS